MAEVFRSQDHGHRDTKRFLNEWIKMSNFILMKKKNLIIYLIWRYLRFSFFESMSPKLSRSQIICWIFLNMFPESIFFNINFFRKFYCKFLLFKFLILFLFFLKAFSRLRLFKLKHLLAPESQYISILLEKKAFNIWIK